MTRPWVALAFALVIGSQVPTAQTGPAAQQTEASHLEWLESVMHQMETIKPGMARAELLTVFTTEGGLSSRERRTFVSRQCRYCKVDVSFELVGQPNGRPSYCIPVEGLPPCDPTVPIFTESDQDRIVTISRPYLQLTVMD